MNTSFHDIFDSHVYVYITNLIKINMSTSGFIYLVFKYILLNAISQHCLNSSGLLVIQWVLFVLFLFFCLFCD